MCVNAGAPDTCMILISATWHAAFAYFLPAQLNGLARAVPLARLMCATAGAPEARMMPVCAARHERRGTYCWLDSSLIMYPEVPHTSLKVLTEGA